MGKEFLVRVNSPPASNLQYYHNGRLMVKKLDDGAIITVPESVAAICDYMDKADAA
ncbi:MAG: hypothetical protein ACRCYS_11370 [Beijerinckiaceae bacterium]